MSQLKLVTDQVNQIILGKEPQVKLALTCLLAGGHLLIEDLPGLGKTTLAHTLSQTMGLSFQRVQFTSDLLPADILGVSIYQRETQSFAFHPGPVFTQVLLADEINRATPKAQSALLEAMEEGQVSIEGETRPLPKPFFVIATQNPATQTGTFPLPESQLDRFLMRVHIGYPSHSAERDILLGQDGRKQLIEGITSVLTAEQLQTLQKEVTKVFLSDTLVDYIQAILAYSRNSSDFVHGLSPRAGLALVSASKAWAFLHDRAHVLPEDVQAILPSVVGHRLFVVNDGRINVYHKGAAEQILQSVPVPV